MCGNIALPRQTDLHERLQITPEIVRLACFVDLASAPGPLFDFERAWYAKICHATSLSTSMGVSMETHDIVPECN